MEHMEFSGKTTEEALARAQEHFNLTLDGLEVEVLDAGSSGLFGLFGAKKARIKARPLGVSVQEQVAELVAGMAEDRKGHPAAASPATNAEAVELPEGEELGEELEEDEEVDPAGEEDDDEDLAPNGKAEEDPEVMSNALEVVQRLVRPLDESARVEASLVRDGVELVIQSQEVGVLIGRRGQTLDALQYLATRIVSHYFGRPIRLVVDAGSYRLRRRQALEELARRMAQKAKQSGRAMAVGPLNAQERRVVHMTLHREPGITTASRGRGELKKVVIAPK